MTGFFVIFMLLLLSIGGMGVGRVFSRRQRRKACHLAQTCQAANDCHGAKPKNELGGNQ